MPSVYEVATLAASLLPVPQNRSPQEAVDLALKLWGIALERKNERSVETARLESSLDRPAAEKRWHQWHRRHLGTAAQAAEHEREVAKWNARGKDLFGGLTWPAAFDDVMRRIMDGSINDGLEKKRHADYSAAWLSHEEPDAIRRATERWEIRKPTADDPILETYPVSPTERLHVATCAWALQRDYDIEALSARLKARAAGFRTEKWDFPAAVSALTFWSNLKATAQRRSAADQSAKKRRGEKMP